jgi:hypothetical protein
MEGERYTRTLVIDTQALLPCETRHRASCLL